MEWLTVEETAHRLGVSVATVRRKAAGGGLAARKSGKQWLIDGEHLPARRRPRAPRVGGSAFDVAAALGHVKATDLRELWVPDVLRYEDQLARPDLVLAAAAALLEDGLPGPAVEVAIAKTPFFTRSAVLLTLEDRIAYQAVVSAIAGKVEATLPETVMAARLAPKGRWFLERGTKLWARWHRRVREAIDEGNPWMIKTDLTSYFDHIPHRLLLEDVSALNPEPRVVDVLRKMLRSWAQVPDMGLPQGPNASRVLGNLYLIPVDRAMLDGGYRYFRYMDDIRIVGPTKSEVVAGMRQLERECRRRGLILSAAKTEMLHGDAAIADGEHPERDIAQYHFDADNLPRARKELKAILTKALRPDGSIEVGSARFSMWRLARIREQTSLSLLMRRLEDLAPVASVLAAYLTHFVHRSRVVDGLADFLDDETRSHSTYLTTWLLAAMLERPGTSPERWTAVAGRLVKDRNQPGYLRSLAAVILARGGRPADVAWIRNELAGEYDPLLLRSYAVALHWAGALDRVTEKSLAARSDELSSTTKYLRGRTAFPSLVYPDRVLHVV